MKFVTIREFRSNMPGVRKDLADGEEIVLTANGRPFALLSPVDPATVEDEIRAIRRARARLAVDRIRGGARSAGLDRMTMGDVDALITKERRQRRSAK